VADNASTDSTAVMARSLGATVVEECRTLTCAAAMNAGIHAANGAILAFMDADALAHPEWLSSALDCMDRTGADIVGGRFELTHGVPPNWWETYDRLLALNQEKFIREQHFSAGGNTIARREMFERVGLFRPDLRWSEDLEWGQRAHAAGAKIVYCPEAIMYHPAKNSWRALANEVRREGQYWGAKCRERGIPLLPAVRRRFLFSPGLRVMARQTACRGRYRRGQVWGLLLVHNALKLPRIVGVLDVYRRRALA